MDVLKTISPLTQEARLEARQNARAVLLKSIGEKPERHNYNMSYYSKYPKWMTQLITILCLIVLVGAFLPSSFRLYVAGSEAFAHGVEVPVLIIISGLATVLMAETAQVVASLALATLGAGKMSKRILYAIMLMSTFLALVGNWSVAQPFNLFSVIEAIFPPLIVLGMSFILKEQMLQTIEIRYSAEKAYQEDLADWNKLASDVELHTDWLQKYAMALRDQLIKTNKRKKSIKINELSLEEWQALVWREMQEENWFNEPSVQVNDPKSSVSKLHTTIDEGKSGFEQSPLEVTVISQNGKNPD